MSFKYDRNRAVDENETKYKNFDSIEILDPKISENLDLSQMQTFAHKVDQIERSGRKDSIFFQ